MSDQQAQIDELRAKLDELLAVPSIRRQIDAHRANLAAMETATHKAAEDMRRREAERADLRRRVEADPLIRVRIAEGARDAHGKFLHYIDVVDPAHVTDVRGTKAHRTDAPRFVLATPGHQVKWLGEPAAVQHHMRTSQWRNLLAKWNELRAHFEAGHFQVDEVPVDQVVADLGREGRLARYYR